MRALPPGSEPGAEARLDLGPDTTTLVTSLRSRAGWVTERRQGLPRDRRARLGLRAYPIRSFVRVDRSSPTPTVGSVTCLVQARRRAEPEVGATAGPPPGTTLLLLDFGGALFCVVDATFNVLAASSPSLEVFGADGTLNLYDPFWAGRGQPVIEVFRRDLVGGLSGWASPDLAGSTERLVEFDRLQRAILVKHFVDCAQSGLRPVLSAEHARHTLEIMLAAQRSARSGSAVSIGSSFTFSGTALELDQLGADH